MSKTFPTPAVPLSQHPLQLPRPEISDEVDHSGIAARGLQRLNELSIGDLTEDAIWRDSYALTGTLRTFYTAKLIVKVWTDLVAKHKPSNFSILPGSSHITRLGSHGAWIEANFKFDITGPRPATSSGIVGLIPVQQDDACPPEWRIWMLSTILEQPHGFPDIDEMAPAPSDRPFELREHYDVAIAGGSIAGLTMASRCEAIGLNYLVIEKQANIGDNWLFGRYDSLKLHTSISYNQLPYRPRTFRQDEEPYHLGTKHISDGFNRFVDTFGMRNNILLSSELVSGSYESDSWRLKVKSTNGKMIDITARHVVLAVGNMGVKPAWPDVLGRDRYQGEIIHGLDWRNADRWDGQNKTGIIIGSANTAHGVTADMAKAGFKSITMIQRSKTFLLPASTFSALVDPVYNYDTPVALSDRMLLGYPLPVQRLMAKAGIELCADAMSEYFDRMEAQGWDIERNGDLWGMMYEHEGKHWLDTGSAELIANGTVKVIKGVPVKYTENGLELSNGSLVYGDVVVCATGYTGNIKDSARKIFGDEVGDQLEEFWRCDAEGESRGAWKWTGHPRLWYTGHGFAHARYYSRFVAMNIKADVLGQPMEMYTETPDV